MQIFLYFFLISCIPSIFAAIGQHLYVRGTTKFPSLLVNAIPSPWMLKFHARFLEEIPQLWKYRWAKGMTQKQELAFFNSVLFWYRIDMKLLNSSLPHQFFVFSHDLDGIKRLYASYPDNLACWCRSYLIINDPDWFDRAFGKLPNLRAAILTKIESMTMHERLMLVTAQK